MSDLVMVALDVLAEMGRSDVDGHVPHPVYSWLATTGAHLAIGMMLGLLSETRAHARVVVTFFALWAAKELSFDLPGGGWSPLTWADSIADLAFGGLGLLLARRAMSEKGSYLSCIQERQWLDPSVAPRKIKRKPCRNLIHTESRKAKTGRAECWCICGPVEIRDTGKPEPSAY